MMFNDVYVDRVGRMSQIEMVFDHFHQHGKTTATVHDIAEYLNMSPSTHLREILNEMVEAGRLHKELFHHRPNIGKWLYSIPNTSPVQRRMAWF